MDYEKYYERFSKNWIRVHRIRKRGFLHKHLFLPPSQWARRHYAKKALGSISARTDFPDLGLVGDPDIVVSLTTFPLRIATVHLTIRSMLLQKVLPGKICLWLAEDEFPEGVDSLPAELRALTANGLEITFVADNLRPHNKYHYCFDKYSDKNIITIDDDLIYSPETIGRLMRLHERFPHAVCTNRVWMRDEQATTSPAWTHVFPEVPSESFKFVALGFGGVLYPRGTYDRAVLDVELFRRLAPIADDLWLKALQIERGVKVAGGGDVFPHPITIPGSQRVTLMNMNEGANQNAIQWQQLDEHFGLEAKLR